jgi:hypothetical protein
MTLGWQVFDSLNWSEEPQSLAKEARMVRIAPVTRMQRWIMATATVAFASAAWAGERPEPSDEASLRAGVANADGRQELALGELQRAVGKESMQRIETLPDGRRFFDELFGSGEALEELMYSGPLPENPEQMLRALYTIGMKDAEGFHERHERTTAAAVALTFGSKKWPEEGAWGRYWYFRESRRAGLLHPMFNEMPTWQKRYVVSAGQNGGWAAPGTSWDDASLEWMRDHVRLPVQAYIGACWQAPYRLHNLFGDSIHGKMYYAPFSGMNYAAKVRLVGGVCGSLSHFGANSARANGIPALTMGEPGHCAYAVRVGPGGWTPAYSLSWKRGLHTSLWGRTWTQLVLQDRSLTDKEAHDRCVAHLFQARSLRETNPELAETAYRLAVEAQPIHFPAWCESVEFLRDVRKPDPGSWAPVQDAVLAGLGKYPEAAWGVISRFTGPATKGLGTAGKTAFLLQFHKATAGESGPVMWDFASALDAQSKVFGKDKQAGLQWFEKVLAIQAGSESWFAPTVAWGQAHFGKDKATRSEFFALLGRVFSSDEAEGNRDGLRAALRPAILAAEKVGDMEAFQALGRAAGVFLENERPVPGDAAKPFPGELLSDGGWLRLSSTSRWDTPELHRGVIGKHGGKFHTNSEVRPHAVVRLGRLGDLSGIVLVNTAGRNAGRQVPIRVSVSEDAKSWREVFRSEKAEHVWRIPLRGKAKRVQFVKVERDDDRKEYFHLAAIQIYGRPLQ